MHDAAQEPSVRYQQTRQAIVRALAVQGAASPSTLLWLCYDPVLHDTLRLQDKKIARLHLDVPAHLEIPATHRPGFVPLEQGLDDDMFEASVTIAVQETQGDALNLDSGRSVCAWLRAKPEAIHRLQRMSSLAKVGEGMRWVRWHDPRVLQQLWPVLDSGQQSCFTQGCSAWTFIDIDGTVQSLASFQNGASSASSDVPIESFSLRSSQWQRLGHNGLSLRIVSQWREACLEASAAGQSTSATFILPRICGLLQQASSYGFVQTDDLSAYTLHHLQGGSLQDTDTQQRMQRALLDPGSLSFHLKALRELS
jgi:hypothetical protein